jgi:NADPH-dependent ferric siderophore reductase
MSLERFPRRKGRATLAAREHVASQTLRLTLRHPAFGAGWPTEQPGEILTLLFTGDEIVLPERGWVFPAGTPAQPWRNYTVRRHRPEREELDVDVVLHDPPGPACEGAAAARVGDAVGFAGPRVDFRPREDAEWLLLVGDETALPAIAAILEADRRAHAVVELPDPSAATPLPPGAGDRVRWVSRDGAPAATTTHLAEAVRALDLPPGPGQAWGAAESRIARGLREVLRDERGMPRSHATVKGYWLRTGEWLDDEG